MNISHKIKWGPLILCIVFPLAVGGISAMLTMSSMEVYSGLNKPPLSPPAIVFPIVWTILFILMGIASYLIWVSDSQNKAIALSLYFVQLAVNFFWTLIFFNMQNYLFAFIWLIALWLLILFTIIAFNKINKTASALLIPYFLWVTFAGYLNFGVYWLNK